MNMKLVSLSLVAILAGCATQEPSGQEPQPGFFGKLWMAPVGASGEGKGPLGNLWMAPGEKKQDEPAQKDATETK